MIAAFDDNDLRKQHYIKKEGSYYILQKVRWDSKDHPSAKCTVSENFLFRTAEAYLNLAEAAALDEDEESPGDDRIVTGETFCRSACRERYR